MLQSTHLHYSSLQELDYNGNYFLVVELQLGNTFIPIDLQQFFLKILKYKIIIKQQYMQLLDWKNNGGQTYSCPRDWRLSS